ncbi:MAG: RNA methyltransferase [Taibaiella sp.]|nr:RNA methyltransferase [Taibaiella sp.]
MQLPEPLLEKLDDIRGFDKEAFTKAHEAAAVTSIRLNPAKSTNAFGNSEQVPWCSEGRYLPERPVFTTDPLYHAGAYYVQEASSMFLSHVIQQLIPERSNLHVLDLCAAPGGKSTLIASLLGKDSLLISNEVIRSRASILEENITRWGYMNTWVTSNDPKDFGKLKGYFDVIVVDAPCSGSGLFRKDERALDEWSESNVQLCAQRQQRILADVWPALKEGGILIYATCSYSQQEDEEILDWLGDDFKVTSLSVELKEEWGVIKTVSKKHEFKGYRFFPHKVQGEGFFIAAVRKNSDEPELKTPRFKSGHDSKVYEQCKYLLQSDDWLCLPGKEGYMAINNKHEQDLHLLQQHVYLRKTGLQLGTPVKNEWLPAHEIALSMDKSQTLPVVDVNKEQALKFLKKEDAGIDGLEKGWYLVSYAGLGLGWIKALGNRVNNYLPKNWRIRMEITDADWA